MDDMLIFHVPNQPTNQPTTWRRVLPMKLIGVQLVIKFSTFLWNSNGHYCIHKHPPLVPLLSWRSILILSFHLCLGLPSGLFQSGLPPKSCTHMSTRLTSLILPDLITRIFGDEWKQLSSLFGSLLHSPLNKVAANSHHSYKQPNTQF